MTSLQQENPLITELFLVCGICLICRERLEARLELHSVASRSTKHCCSPQRSSEIYPGTLGEQKLYNSCYSNSIQISNLYVYIQVTPLTHDETKKIRHSQQQPQRRSTVVLHSAVLLLLDVDPSLGVECKATIGRFTRTTDINRSLSPFETSLHGVFSRNTVYHTNSRSSSLRGQESCVGIVGP